MSGEEAARREEWEQLRVTVRKQRTERGMSIAQLAAAIGSSATTLKTCLGMKRPPSHRLRERLEAWVVSAPEVVPAEAAFQRNGTRRASSNGADTGAGAAAA
jgi:ribosome-binding protein aMBF1 (putative translation factor)